MNEQEIKRAGGEALMGMLSDESKKEMMLFTLDICTGVAVAAETIGQSANKSVQEMVDDYMNIASRFLNQVQNLSIELRKSTPELEMLIGSVLYGDNSDVPEKLNSMLKTVTEVLKK